MQELQEQETVCEGDKTSCLQRDLNREKHNVSSG